ncbi:MAG: hypothetical protein AAF974_02425 [Cyanobacteria bacterium P01_E01_bin.34]
MSAPVSASTYQRLLVELRARQQENEHLRHLTQQLRNDMSVLQAKYAQAIASAPPTGQPDVLGQSGGAGPTDTRESLTPITAPPSSPQDRQPQAARQAISRALAKLNAFERPSPSNPKQSEQPNSERSATPLPELSILNRLRETKEPKPTILPQGVRPAELNSLEQTLPEISASKSSSSGARAIPDTSAPSPSPESPSSVSFQLENRAGVENRPKVDGPPSLSPVFPLLEDEPILDFDSFSPYQKARQEHAQTAPIWMWLLAWLLLLPISAGLGYTFVQWVMNPGAPSSSPPLLEQAE